MPAVVKREVRATYVDTDGQPMRGVVSFTPSVTLVDADGNIVLSRRAIYGQLGENGLLSIELPVTDDARHTPTDWHYIVNETLQGSLRNRDTYWIQVPQGSGPIELAAQVVDTDPPKPMVRLLEGPKGDDHVPPPPTGSVSGDLFVLQANGSGEWGVIEVVEDAT